MNSTNTVVANAMAAKGVARNSVEVEVSLMYAGRVQHAMRDAARTVSGVRITGSNTLYCPNDDAADEVVDILEQAGVPKREISLNSKRVARNADYTDATNRLRLCLDSLYKADDYRNEAVGIVAQLINEGVLDKAAASKMNELQRLLGQAMAVGKDLYYNRIRP